MRAWAQVGAVPLLVSCCLTCSPSPEPGGSTSLVEGSDPGSNPRVIPVYVIPSDLRFDHQRLRLHAAAIEDVRQWYFKALRGRTFHYEPMIVQHSRHSFAELADSNFQAWWPLLIEEFRDYGFPWDERSDFKLLFLVQGAGGWAGADSENGGIEAVAEAAVVGRGEFGGVVIIGDSSVSGILNGVCPTSGISGGTVWWCNWDTYRGTIAHELGHTWGIPHPDAFLKPGPDGERRPWSCDEFGNTVMQCHWRFPYDSLLTYEAKHFRSLSFFSYPGSVQYQMLSDLLPDQVDGEVTFHRLGVDPQAIAWIDGRGSGTGYAWAVELSNGGVQWQLDGACYRLDADVGRARGAGGSATVYVVADGDTLRVEEVAGEPPRRISVDLCNRGRLEVSVGGQSRFKAVLANARLVEREGPHR